MNRSTMKTSEWRQRCARRALATVAFAALPAAAWCADGAAAPVTKLEKKDGPTGITSWLYAGMFPSTDLVQPDQNGPRRTGYDTDFLTAIGGEAAARPHEGTKITAPTGSVEFKRRTWNTNYIDLTEVFGRPERVCAYLYAEVESPKDTSLFLHFGCNDAGKVWIAGKLVAARPTDGSAQRSQSVALVELKGGRNPLLVKVDQAGSNWGVYVEFWDKASSLAPASVAIGGGMSDTDLALQIEMVRGIIRDLRWPIVGIGVLSTALMFGWIPLLIWLYFRSKNRNEQRVHELQLAMVERGMSPAMETQKPRRQSGRWLFVWGLVLTFAGAGLFAAEMADSGLRNAGFELAVMLSGVALLGAAGHLRRAAERDHREEEPPARPNDAS